MYKRAYPTDEERQAHFQRWWKDARGYEPPENFKEIDEREFLRKFFLNSYDKQEQRWIKLDEGSIVSAQFFFEHSDDNVAIVDFRGKARYFSFGCDHRLEFVENLGRCYNRYRCPKCGRTFDLDSSD